MNSDGIRVGGKNRGRWPTALDPSDPEGIADFLLGLGYDREKVVNTLCDRCSLDRITARRIVTDVVQQQGGQS